MFKHEKIIQDVKRKKKERNKSKQKAVFRRKLVYLKRCVLFSFPMCFPGKPINRLIEEAARDEFSNICIASQINGRLQHIDWLNLIAIDNMARKMCVHDNDIHVHAKHRILELVPCLLL